MSIAVQHALGHGLLAVEHQHVDELGEIDAAVQRVGQDIALGNFTTTGHGTPLSVFSRPADPV